MKRITTFITEAQFFFLNALSGTLSEHIRRALDDYIATKRAVNVSASKSTKLDIDPRYPESEGKTRAIEKLRKEDKYNG